MSSLPNLPRPPRIASIDPNTGAVWKEWESASTEEVAAAVARARSAQSAWAARPLRERAAAVGRIRGVLFERRDELISILQKETGKPAFEALFEVLVTADAAHHAARHAPRALRVQRFHSRHVALLRKSVEIHWEPFGVVAIIAPWNYPLLLASSSLFPSLAAGNAVVLKPSELTSGVGMALIDVVREAGLPHDLVHCLPGDGRTGAALLAAGVDRVFFTGSEATGRKVAAECGARLIPCSLELGGSDPAIVLDDADLAAAAAGIAWGRFSNSGQTCVAPKRVFVTAPGYDRFLAEISAVMSRLRTSGEDRDTGPLIRPRQVELLVAQRSDALARGALVAARAGVATADGYHHPLEILTDVPRDARVMTEETFGPLLPVVKVGSVDEAIALANASTYGLSASIWSRDLRGARAIARRIRAGTVMINDSTLVAGMTEVPHGGVGSSGMGRVHGQIGLTEAARPKSIVIDPFASWKQVWWFPYTRRMLDGMSAFFVFSHGRGLLRRFAAGVKAVRLLYFR